MGTKEKGRGRGIGGRRKKKWVGGVEGWRLG